MTSSPFNFDQYGIIRPHKIDKPIIARFLVEFISIYCRFPNTRPRNIPKPTTCSPPTTGYGMVMRTLVNLPKTARTISMIPSSWKILLLAT